MRGTSSPNSEAHNPPDPPQLPATGAWNQQNNNNPNSDPEAYTYRDRIDFTKSPYNKLSNQYFFYADAGNFHFNYASKWKQMGVYR